MDKNKLILLIFLGIFLISFASALDNAGVGKQNQNFTFCQTCSDATFITLSTLQFPDRTVIPINTNMTASGSSFCYNITTTSQLGRYDITGFSNGCENTYATYFEITYSGDKLDTAGAILNLGFLTLIILLLLVVVFSISNLPSGNDEDDYGNLLSINNLKYFNYALYIIGYGLLITVFFLSSNLALAYLSSMFGNILFVVYKILMILGIPFVVILLLIIIINIFKDKEMKNIIERGGSIGDI